MKFLWRDAKIDNYQRMSDYLWKHPKGAKTVGNFFSTWAIYHIIDAVLVSCATDFSSRSLAFQSGLQQHSQN